MDSIKTSHRYSTALSHLVLAGTGIYCLTVYHDSAGDNLRFPYGTFVTITCNSLVGTWRWGNPDYGGNVDGLYKMLGFFQNLFALPCLVTETWLNYGYQKELAYLHTGAVLIPLVLYLLDKGRGDLLDLIIVFNTVSLGVVSFLQKNYFGLAAAISYAFNYFAIREGNFDFDIPIQDLYNYGLCFYTYFALRSLQG